MIFKSWMFTIRTFLKLNFTVSSQYLLWEDLSRKLLPYLMTSVVLLLPRKSYRYTQSYHWWFLLFHVCFLKSWNKICVSVPVNQQPTRFRRTVSCTKPSPDLILSIVASFFHVNFKLYFLIIFMYFNKLL